MIKNREELLKACPDSGLVLDLIDEGINKVLPKNIFKDKFKLNGDKLEIHNRVFDLSSYKKIFVFGFGKSSSAMAQEVDNLIGDKITLGFVNSIDDVKFGKIQVLKSTHPLPSEINVENTKRILSNSESLNKDDLVICLVSGGGSAMFVNPQGSISIGDLSDLNDLLIKSGANITEMNAVRKHVSNVKGGRFVKHLYPATVVSLIISDVTTNDLSVIASGPTYPDNSTFQDAMDVIDKYRLKDKIPESVKGILNNGLNKGLPETIKAEDTCWDMVHNFIVAKNSDALNVMADTAKSKGVDAEIIQEAFDKDVVQVAEHIISIIESYSGGEKIILVGGEPTVNVKGKGVGGRNQELCLRLIEKIKGKGIIFASVATDGVDFLEESAGAVIDGDTFDKIIKKGLHIKTAIEDNDSHTFLKKLDQVIVTGKTGTNVFDIMVIHLK